MRERVFLGVKGGMVKYWVTVESYTIVLESSIPKQRKTSLQNEMPSVNTAHIPKGVPARKYVGQLLKYR